MIKLASIALLPVLAATFYSQPESQPSAEDFQRARVDMQDRQFLAALNTEEAARTHAQRADQAFLASLQADDSRGAMSKEIPVMRAIAIERALPAIPVGRVAVIPAPAAEPVEEVHEVRRAIPIVNSPSLASPASPDLRKAFHQPFITMIEPEVRRATATDRPRASIEIYGDQVIVRQ